MSGFLVSGVLVSVVLPFRDAERTLPEAIASVLACREVALEVVAIDDGSVDRSAAVALEAAGSDPRLRLVRGTAHGLVPALQRGLAEARGRWIARMDADDWSHPERLPAQLALAEATGAHVVATQVEPWPGDPLTDGMARYYAWSNALLDHEALCRELWVESPIVHPTALVAADWIARVGGYRDGDFPEDYDLWLRLAEAGARFAKVDRPLLRWRDRDERLTRTDPRYSVDAFRRLKAQHLAARLMRSGQACVQIWGAGPDGKAWVPALEAHGVEVRRFFDIDPRKIGGRVRGRIPVRPWSEVARHRDALLLAAVGARGARALIRAQLLELGFVEGREFLCVQ